LPLTRGCSNNTCTFCAFWGGHKLQIRELADVKKEIDALALYMKHDALTPGTSEMVYAIARSWDGKRVFLQDGDALVYPFPKLVEALSHLRVKLPGIVRVASYATPQDILRRTVPELRQLKDLGMGMLYMGIESGDDGVLKETCKGATHDEMVIAGRKAKESGITISVTVILGLGGVEGSRRHASETARVLTEIDPEFAGALTLTLVPGTPLWKKAQRGEFHLINPFQSLEELRVLVEESRFTDCFFSSMHASNYLTVRGRLPPDKARILGEIDGILARKDPHMLKPEFMRGL